MLEKGIGQPFMNKFLHLIGICVSVLFLSGCWDRIEVNDLAIVTAAAIDKSDDNQIELSLQIFIPKTIGSGGGVSGGSGGGKMTIVASQKGRNMADAISKLQGKLPRVIFWGQCKVYIFGEELAKQGIRKEMDLLLRHPETRERAYLYVSEKKAKGVLELVPNLERYSAEVLRGISNNQVGMQVTTQDADEMFSGLSQAAALPYLKIIEQEASEGKPVKYVFIDGTAVFHKDQMVGTINEAHTRGVLWLRDQIKGYTINVKFENEEGLVSLNPVSAQVELIPQIQNEKWVMTVNIDTEGSIVQNETKLDLTNPSLFKEVENLYQNSIEERIHEVLNELQHELNVDIVDFSKEFYRKYPKEFKEVENRWGEMFSEVEVNLNVNAYIRRAGYINKPGALQNKEVKEE